MITTNANARPDRRDALLRTAILGGCLLAFGGQAWAHTFCATNAAQLRAALADVSDGGAYNAEENTIYISGGTHHTNGKEFFYSSTDPHTLNIIGTGEQACGVIEQKASLTILDGDDKSRVFETHSTRGAVLFQYLTIQHGNVGENEHGGGLLMNDLVGDNGQPLVNLVIIRDNHAYIDGGFLIGNGGNFGIDFLNNLVVRNSADIADGGGGIVYDGANGTGTRINSNTFADNKVVHHPAGEVGGLYVHTATPDTMSNNIFWNNSGFDVKSDIAALVDDDYGTDFSAPAAGSSGNLQVNPHFVGPANFRLSASSPLLGMGTLNPPGGYLSGIDIRAKPRTVNGTVDIGAYERQAGASSTDDDSVDDADTD
jgi:hypothetical protein